MKPSRAFTKRKAAQALAARKPCNRGTAPTWVVVAEPCAGRVPGWVIRELSTSLTLSHANRFIERPYSLMTRLNPHILKAGILSGICAALCLPIFAQEPIAPLPTAPAPREAPAEPMVETLEAPDLGGALIESGAMEPGDLDAAESAVAPPVTGGMGAGRAGRWKISPHFELRVIYDDNIFIRPNNQVDDFIIAASPGLAIGYWDNEEEMARYLDRTGGAGRLNRGVGNFFVLDYTAILLSFAKTSSQNAFDQDVLLDAGWQFGKLTLGAGTRFESKSEADIDIGGRVRRTALTSKLEASYQLSERTSVEANFYNEVKDRENFIGTVEWRNENYLDYALTPLVNIALGIAVGSVDVETGADQVFERILGRASYDLTGKLSLHARGGVEFRQSDGSGDHVNPVVDVAVRYSLSEGTLIALDAFRRVETAASRPDELYTATGVSLRLERSLANGLHFSIEGGYATTAYSESGGSDGRSDDFFYARAGLLYNFAQWGNVGVGYEYRRNNSTNESSSFENNQIYMQVGLIY